MSKPRIKREKKWEAGEVVFTDLNTKDTLTCDMAELFPFYNMDVAAAIDYLGSLETPEAPVLGEVQKRGICHMVNAKVGDSASDPNDSAVDQMDAVWGALKDGNWGRASGTGAGGRAAGRREEPEIIRTELRLRVRQDPSGRAA